jgi:hypothetical protein
MIVATAATGLALAAYQRRQTVQLPLGPLTELAQLWSLALNSAMLRAAIGAFQRVQGGALSDFAAEMQLVHDLYPHNARRIARF